MDQVCWYAGIQATVVRFIDLSPLSLSFKPDLAKSQLILLSRRVSSLHMFCPTKYFQEVGGEMVLKQKATSVFSLSFPTLNCDLIQFMSSHWDLPTNTSVPPADEPCGMLRQQL